MFLETKGSCRIPKCLLAKTELNGEDCISYPKMDTTQFYTKTKTDVICCDFKAIKTNATGHVLHNINYYSYYYYLNYLGINILRCLWLPRGYLIDHFVHFFLYFLNSFTGQSTSCIWTTTPHTVLHAHTQGI